MSCFERHVLQRAVNVFDLRNLRASKRRSGSGGGHSCSAGRGSGSRRLGRPARQARRCPCSAVLIFIDVLCNRAAECCCGAAVLLACAGRPAAVGVGIQHRCRCWLSALPAGPL
eukprot:353933-Chlamydomonas_euryale.AAC.5